MNYEERVKALRVLQDKNSLSYYKRRVCKDAADAIEALQAEVPKRGKWELIDGSEPMRWGCSRCKYMSWETSTYCPRCGAKMEAQE